MSHQKKQGRRAATNQRRRQRRAITLGGVVLGAVVVVAALAAFARSNDAAGNTDGSSAATAPSDEWSATTYTGGPRLAVDQRDIDHGEVPYGHAVQATYRLRNVGDQPLNLGTPTVNILEGC